MKNIKQLFFYFVHKKYGYPCTRLILPIGILGALDKRGKFLYHYLIHNKKGTVIKGEESLFTAITYVKSHKGYYLSHIIN